MSRVGNSSEISGTPLNPDPLNPAMARVSRRTAIGIRAAAAVVGLKNIREVCEFEDDIKYERLELAKFAVELYDVINIDFWLSSAYPRTAYSLE